MVEAETALQAAIQQWMDRQAAWGWPVTGETAARSLAACLKPRMARIEKRFQSRLRALRNVTDVLETQLCHADVLARSMTAPDAEADPAGHAEYLSALGNLRLDRKTRPRRQGCRQKGDAGMKGVPRRNRVTACPNCGGKLRAGKNAYASDAGFIYRARVCRACGAATHTKQAPEEITGVE